MARALISTITRPLAVTVALGVALSACASVDHIGASVQKRRNYESPVDLSAQRQATANGSLYSTAGSTAYIFADQRAMRVGDIVTVRVVEQAAAERGAATELNRESSMSLGLPSLFGLIEALGDTLGEKISRGELLEAVSQSDFVGGGSTSRRENLQATVPCLVVQVLPNGNLFVEGQRVVLVNQEEQHYYVSGLVRPSDILDDNSVPSYLLADAEIEFTGRGDISEYTKRGWLHRALDAVAPF